MSIQNALIIALIGSVAGLFGGLLGLGGAIVIIPALVMILGYSQQLAQGTTLLMLVLPVGALAAWQYYRSGNADWKAALILAVTFFVSSYFGARFANAIPQEVLKKMFAVLLIIIALRMLFFERAVR